MYAKLSAIKGAASFNNLGPILSEPVALVRSIFLHFFHRIFLVLKKGVIWNYIRLQNSVSKLEVSIGCLILMLHLQKNIEFISNGF